jgi:hypothetical protein
MSERTVSRVDLATEQLAIALSLFLKGQSLVSALTLAGAAEEILARALQRRGKTTALQHWYQNSALHAPDLSWASFSCDENRAKNAAKHLNLDGDIEEKIDLRDAAALMLYRACTNYEWLGNKRTKRMRVFERWFWNWAT